MFRQLLKMYRFKSFSRPLHAIDRFFSISLSLALLANHYFPISTIFHTRMLHHCIPYPQGPISTGFTTWLSLVTTWLFISCYESYIERNHCTTFFFSHTKTQEEVEIRQTEACSKRPGGGAVQCKLLSQSSLCLVAKLTGVGFTLWDRPLG